MAPEGPQGGAGTPVNRGNKNDHSSEMSALVCSKHCLAASELVTMSLSLTQFMHKRQTFRRATGVQWTVFTKFVKPV
jgi:hypothetical protein